MALGKKALVLLILLIRSTIGWVQEDPPFNLKFLERFLRFDGNQYVNVFLEDEANFIFLLHLNLLKFMTSTYLTYSNDREIKFINVFLLMSAKIFG